MKTYCDCELRNRQWDPDTGKCRTCGSEYQPRVNINDETRDHVVIVDNAEVLLCVDKYDDGRFVPIINYTHCPICGANKGKSCKINSDTSTGNIPSDSIHKQRLVDYTNLVTNLVKEKVKASQEKTIDPNEATCEPVNVNLQGLRDALFDELNLLRSNRISAKRARVTSQLAKRIIETVTLDLFAQRLLGPDSAENLKRLRNPNIHG